MTHALTVQWAVKIEMKYSLIIKTTKSSEKYMFLFDKYCLSFSTISLIQGQAVAVVLRE